MSRHTNPIETPKTNEGRKRGLRGLFEATIGKAFGVEPRQIRDDPPGRFPASYEPRARGSNTDSNPRREPRPEQQYEFFQHGSHGHQIGKVVNYFAGGSTSDFWEPRLDQVDPANGLDIPERAFELSRDLQDWHFLILGGAGLSEKLTLAQQIAWQLREESALIESSVGSRLVVRQWSGTLERTAIAAYLQQKREPSIIILNEAKPVHLGYNALLIRSLCQKSGHYVIVTTDSTVEEWALRPEEQAEIWRELTAEETYSSVYLGKYLLELLLNKSSELSIRSEPLPGGSPESLLHQELAPGLSVADTVTNLRSPERIRIFVEWWIQDESPRNREEALKLFRRLQGSHGAISSWYRQFDRRIQLLIAAVVLLDGMLDDQLFATLDILSSSDWRERDPTLAAFDYDDLSRLGAYVRQSPNDEGGSQITVLTPSHRDVLLQVAWERHRRQILASIPVLLEIANRAADWFNVAFPVAAAPRPIHRGASSKIAGKREKNRPRTITEAQMSRWHEYGPDRELFGTIPRKARVLQALADSFSVLGLLSRNAVERALHQIAANKDWQVRQIAVSAMARWKEHPDHPRLLYHTLYEWQSEARSLGEQRSDPDDIRKFMQIRASILEIVGYAVRYDPPNQLAMPLQELIERSLDDEALLVRAALTGLTVPLAVGYHLKQLEDLIPDWLEHEGLMEAVAEGWAFCLKLRPQEGLDLLDDWHRAYANASSDPQKPAGPTERCAALLAVTYGEVSPTESTALTSDEVSNRLRRLLVHPHPFVRLWAIKALTKRIEAHLDRIPSHLQEALVRVPPSEEELVVDAFREFYLRQRSEQEGGDYFITHEGKDYDLWSRRESRSLTTVEETLHQWISDESVPRAQKFALAALAEIRDTPVDRAERQLQHFTQAEEAKQLKQEQKKETEVTEVARPPVVDESPPGPSLGYFQRLLLYLATWGDDFVRTTVDGLAAETVSLHDKQPQKLQTLIKEFESQGGRLAMVAETLRRFVNLYRYRRWSLPPVIGGLGWVVWNLLL